MSKAKGTKNWTPEELESLENLWSTKVSIPGIAKKLGRSCLAVKLKAQRLGLGRKLWAGEWVTLCQLIRALCNNSAGSQNYKRISYIKNRGLPVKQIRVDKNKFTVVYLDDFWDWAYENKSFLDFSKFEPLLLGKEPVWVAQKRKDDIAASLVVKKTPWSAVDDARLKMLIGLKKTYSEIAGELGRSEGAVVRRISTLKLEGRPVRIPAHAGHWSREQYIRLRDLIVEGKPWALIARELGKSVKACKGRAYDCWGSENQDKIRNELMFSERSRFDDLLNGRGRVNARQRKQ